MSYSWPIFVTQFRDYVQQYPQLTRVAILPTLTGNSGFVLTVNAGQTDVAWTAAGSGGIGTVTSVALTMPNIFGVSGSPITTSGTITSTLNSQNANIVFAGPTSGVASAPTFRALVTADLPAGTTPVGANPTANIGLTAVNGSAATFLRSDGAPALSQSIAPTWAGVHIFNAGNLTLQDATTTGHTLIFASNSSTALTANHTLTIDVVNADRTIKLTGNPTLADWFDQSVKTTANVTFDSVKAGGGANTGTIGDASNYWNAGYFGTGGLSTDAINARVSNITSTANWNITGTLLTSGTITAPSVVINGNAASLPAGIANSYLQIGGVDGTNARLLIDAFGAVPILNFRVASGTNASKSALTQNQTMSSIGAFGYGATGYLSGAKAALNFVASENWSDTASGTLAVLNLTAAGTTTVATVVTFTTTSVAITGVLDINGSAASATAGHLNLGSGTQSTIGANGAASALTANPLGYIKAFLGTTAIIIPYYNA